MVISKDFLTREIADLRAEMQKAQTFCIQCEATIRAYEMLVNKLDAPDECSAEAPEARPEGSDAPG